MSALLALTASFTVVGCRSATWYARKIEYAHRRSDALAEDKYVDKLAGLGRQSVAGLLALLENDDSRVCLLAFDVLERLAFPQLSRWEFIRRSQMGEGPLPPPRQLPWLRPVLVRAAEHSDALVRQVAVRLITIHVDDSWPVLARAANDRDSRVRCMAFWSMRHLRAPVLNEAHKALAKGLSDRDTLVRASAVLTAGHLRLNSCLPRLIKLLDDQTKVQDYIFERRIVWSRMPRSDGDPGVDFVPRIDQLAAHAVQKISGRHFGFTTCYDSRRMMVAIVRRIRQAKLCDRGK